MALGRIYEAAEENGVVLTLPQVGEVGNEIVVRWPDFAFSIGPSSTCHILQPEMGLHDFPLQIPEDLHTLVEWFASIKRGSMDQNKK